MSSCCWGVWGWGNSLLLGAVCRAKESGLMICACEGLFLGGVRVL